MSIFLLPFIQKLKRYHNFCFAKNRNMVFCAPSIKIAEILNLTNSVLRPLYLKLFSYAKRIKCNQK